MTSVWHDTGDGRGTILIGGDHPHIIDKQLDKREGKYGEPIAVRTPLRWTVHGPFGYVSESGVHVNFTRTEQERLNAQLEGMYDVEFSESKAYVEKGLSGEDREAREIMERSATLLDGHYQLKLSFRQDHPDQPDSLPAAESRLKWLKGKMQKDQVFHSKYSAVVEKYHAEGASRQVPDDKRILNLCGIFHITLSGTPENQKNW